MYEERKEGISVRDILIQLLFVVLFVFILVWLFPTKSDVDRRFADINDKLAVIDALTQNMFADNLDRMKSAATSYYTKERLPKNINDVTSITLREMINKKLLLEFKDAKGKSCDLDKSYVEVIKLEEEYQMKVNLVCSDTEGYIIVHLGCYNYCKDAICEKEVSKPVQTTPVVPTPKPTPIEKTCTYEYMRVTNGRWGAWGAWSSWTTNVITQTDFRKVETQIFSEKTGTEAYQTGTVAQYDNSKLIATPKTYCTQGTLYGNYCLVSSSVSQTATCSSGYYLSNGVCYSNTTSSSTHIVSRICMDSSYTRSGYYCYKTTSSASNVAKECPDSSYTSYDSTQCRKSATSNSAVAKVCPSGSTASSSSSTGCVAASSTSTAVAKVCPSGSTASSSSSTGCVTTSSSSTAVAKVCPSGSTTSTSSSTGCVTTSSTYDYKPKVCPSGSTASSSSSTGCLSDVTYSYAGKVCDSTYTLNTSTGKCVKAGTTTYTKGAYVDQVVLYNATSPSNTSTYIYEFDGKKNELQCTPGCVTVTAYVWNRYKTIATVVGSDTKDYTCPSGYTTYSGSVTQCRKQSSGGTAVAKVCSDSTYTSYDANQCRKSVTSNTAVAKVCPSGSTASSSSSTGCVTTSSTSTAVAKVCPTGSTASSSSSTGCVTTSSTSVPVSKVCPSGSTASSSSSTGCVTTSSSYVYATKVCPSGYYDAGTYCSKDAVQSVVEAVCPAGYTPTPNDVTCQNTTAGYTNTHTPYCPSGYSLNGNICYGTSQSQVAPTTTITYSCSSGYTLDSSNRCYTYVPTYGYRDVYSNIRKYRYSERAYIDGTKDYKWSKSTADTSLLNQGYGLTGKSACN